MAFAWQARVGPSGMVNLPLLTPAILKSDLARAQRSLCCGNGRSKEPANQGLYWCNGLSPYRFHISHDILCHRPHTFVNYFQEVYPYAGDEHTRDQGSHTSNVLNFGCLPQYSLKQWWHPLAWSSCVLWLW
jgi:hypothetical protein